jgi:hypothetical protein
MPIDVFAEFEVFAGGSWRPVHPTPTPIEHNAGTVYVPSLREQLDITRKLGRPKDLARIARLESLLATSPQTSPRPGKLEGEVPRARGEVRRVF